MGNIFTWCGESKRQPEDQEKSIAVSAPSPSFQVKKNVIAKETSGARGSAGGGDTAFDRTVSKESMLKSQFDAYAGAKKTAKKKKKKKKKKNPYASADSRGENASEFPAPPERRAIEESTSEWKALLDEATGRTYYWNRTSNVTTWEIPKELEASAQRKAISAENGGYELHPACKAGEKGVQHVSTEDIKLTLGKEIEDEQKQRSEFETGDRANDKVFFKEMKARKLAEQAKKEEAERRMLANMDETERDEYIAKKMAMQKHEKQKARMVR